MLLCVAVADCPLVSSDHASDVSRSSAESPCGVVLCDALPLVRGRDRENGEHEHRGRLREKKSKRKIDLLKKRNG